MTDQRLNGVDIKFESDVLVPDLLTGRRVSLRPVTPGDYGFIAALETDPANLIRWRHRGSTPSPDQLIGTIWDGALAVFIVCSNSSGMPLGLLSAYGADFKSGICNIAGISQVSSTKINRYFEGAILFLEYLFRVWPFRKLYAEVPEYNLDSLRSLRTIWTQQDRLTDHDYLNGRYWDRFILSLTRSEWDTKGAALREFAICKPTENGKRDDDRDD